MALKKMGFVDGLQERLAKRSSAIAKVRSVLNGRVDQVAERAKEIEKQEFVQKYIQRKVDNQRLAGGGGGMHYGKSLDVDAMTKWASNVAMDIRKSLDGQFPVLLYRGMSGISAATYLSAALHEYGVPHGKAYVRKEHEKSHGSEIERYNMPNHTVHQVVFVVCDDFICTGDTVVEILNKFQMVMRFRLHANMIMAALTDCSHEVQPMTKHIGGLQATLDVGWDKVVKKIEREAYGAWDHKMYIEERSRWEAEAITLG